MKTLRGFLLESQRRKRITKESWKPGETAHFEYHCFQSHCSSDAELWYRSQQPVTVHSVDKTSDGHLARAAGVKQSERLEQGTPIIYKVQFSDGHLADTFEDELLTHPKHYSPEYRPGKRPKKLKESDEMSPHQKLLQRMVDDHYEKRLDQTEDGPENEVIQAVANNPSTHPDTLHELRDHTHWGVRFSVANNPSTHAKTLDHLADDESTMLIRRAARNPNVSNHTLRRLRDTVDDSSYGGIITGLARQILHDRANLGWTGNPHHNWTPDKD